MFNFVLNNEKGKWRCILIIKKGSFKKELISLFKNS